MKTAPEIRGDLIEFLKRDLVGPAHGDDEVLEERPSLRYSAGVLFPRETDNDESSEVAGVAEDGEAEVAAEAEPLTTSTNSDDEIDGDSRGGDDDDYDDSVTLANSFKPAALGLSFVTNRPDVRLVVQVDGAHYVKGEDPESKQLRWSRRAFDLEPTPFSVDPSRPWQVSTTTVVPGLNLRLVSRKAKEGDRFFCTLSLFNTTRMGAQDALEFFQAGLSVRHESRGVGFCEYRTRPPSGRDDEETRLALLYRNRRVYAVGHGCAADWSFEGGLVQLVSTATIPTVRVPPVLPRAAGDRFLDMQFLAGEAGAEPAEIPEALERLASEYEGWISEREAELPNVEPSLESVAKGNLATCRIALNRIRLGIRVLTDDPRSLRAFMLLNRAMLRQQVHSRRRRRIDDPFEPFPQRYESIWTENVKRGYWRTFQLAFILMSLPGLVLEHDEEVAVGEGPDGNPVMTHTRGIVDLIWFPTGGGKTEAYLGLAAFAIFHRRLRDPGADGCTVLMRYTLRLLTSQQFQRAASLICACELLRREDEDALGTSPISIGLWVGKSLTPNDTKEAVRMANRLGAKDATAKNVFQLLSCPWCGTELANQEALGYVEQSGRQVFKCPGNAKRHGDDACPFSTPKSPLPVSVVDDDIYRRPPTLLIGTVDKFATLAWRDDAGELFGGGTRQPPELIIQDELHLISGPLGSMVGLYESVVELLCRGDKVVGPKVVASTATIRRASEQCRHLYDRPSFQFPPPGLDASDSFFAEEEQEDLEAGRIYVGLLPSAASSPLTAQIRTVAALSQGLTIVADEETPDEAIDPYWTLVQYFSSLKELGRAATLVTGDIPEYLPSMHRRYGLEKDDRRWMGRHEELTSRKREDEIPKILEALETRHRSDAEGVARALDTVLATNMISVGVDVERLGLMLVVTQPKGTSEYIQATSRVGRSSKAPGLVVTLYNGSRPRDRSHYEQFRGYHESFYQHVEPTSVTPFAVPALERGLHALIVIVARHLERLAKPEGFDAGSTWQEKARSFLVERAHRIDEVHADRFQQLLDQRSKEWTRFNPEEWGKPYPSDDEARPLMFPFGGQPPHGYESWPTPTSLRNVDVECGAGVEEYPNVSEET